MTGELAEWLFTGLRRRLIAFCVIEDNIKLDEREAKMAEPAILDMKVG